MPKARKTSSNERRLKQIHARVRVFDGFMKILFDHKCAYRTGRPVLPPDGPGHGLQAPAASLRATLDPQRLQQRQHRGKTTLHAPPVYGQRHLIRFSS